ncbi:hypothetical protein NQK81_21325 [Amycolatopsis roodepoortensis]|nr:hypothetical protein [Amycolatopsis roodepoortensis]UUV36514.1 hypothetical protein NQK81_21325 [Amycolatopsis roodepoortensis]
MQTIVPKEACSQALHGSGKAGREVLAEQRGRVVLQPESAAFDENE